MTFAPVLVVDGDTVLATPAQLAGASVTATVVGEELGPEDPRLHLQEQVEPEHPVGSPPAVLDHRHHRIDQRRPADATAAGRRDHRSEPDMSKTKGGGSTRNGRDSNAQRLGVKAFGGTTCGPGPSWSASAGTKFHPGLNVGLGGDDTLFALADGTVQFASRKGRKLVDVVAGD